MLKPAKAICRQACADGADGFQGVYSDESAIFAIFRVCIAMTTALRHLMPSGSVSISPLGGFRLEDSAALSSQGRSMPNRAGANQVTNTTNQLSGLPFHVDIQQLCQPLCLFWLAKSLSLIML